MRRLLSLLLCMLLCLSLLPAAAADGSVIASGECGDENTSGFLWKLDSSGTLTIDNMWGESITFADGNPPWNAYRAQIKTLVFDEHEYNWMSTLMSIFNDLPNLELVRLPSHMSKFGHNFYGCPKLRAFEIVNSENYVVRDGVLFFYAGDSIELICYPPAKPGPYTIAQGVTRLAKDAFRGSAVLKDVWFLGSPPSDFEDCFTGVTATAHYYLYDEYWTPNKRQNYGGTITWVGYTSVITSQPQDYTGKIGAKASFSVAAMGVGLTYRWQIYSGGSWINTDWPGYNTAKLEPTISSSNDGARFRCVITDESGNQVTSNAATLHVYKLAITEQPKDYSGPAGTNASFSVKATGKGLFYMWQVLSGGSWQDVYLPGNYFEGPDIQPPISSSSDGTKYRCRIQDEYGNSLTSNIVTLHVIPGITTQPKSVTASAGSTATFKVAANDATGYQWQYYSSVYGAWYDLTNSAYSGAKTNTMSVQATTARNGYLFRCAVSNANGTVYTNSVKLTVQTAKPTITAQPSNVTKTAGETASFTVTATGATSYQWQYYSSVYGAWYDLTNSAYSGAKTATMSVQATAARNGYLFRCAVSNAGGTVYTNSVKLTVNCKPTITAQPSNATKAEGETASFKVTATDATSYQWQYYSETYKAWYNITNAAYSGAKTATMSVQATAARNGYLFRCAVSNAGGTVYTNSVKLTVNCKPTITSQPSNVTKTAGETASFTVKATGASSYQWQYYSETYKAWYNITNSAYSGAKTAAMSVQATAARNGYLFRCAVTNAGGTVYTNSVKLTVNSKPVITAQPSNVTKAAGQTATFTVAASGATSYQWQYYSETYKAWYNLTNSAYAGAKTNSMSVQATAARNGFIFRCAITNAAGTVYTNSVKLTVSG